MSATSAPRLWSLSRPRPLAFGTGFDAGKQILQRSNARGAITALPGGDDAYHAGFGAHITSLNPRKGDVGIQALRVWRYDGAVDGGEKARASLVVCKL